MTYPLTTTLNRIWAMCPCEEGKARALAAAGKSVPDDEPITFAQILKAVGLDDAIWCCRAEPQHSREWRLFATWCARSVEHLMSDPRSLAALDVAERYASGEATDEELIAARAAAWAAVWAAADPVAWAAAWAADADAAAAAAADAAADAAGRAAAWAAVWAAADPVAWAAAWAADAAADADARAAVREAQAAAFLQLVTTGTLPAVGQEVAA